MTDLNALGEVQLRAAMWATLADWQTYWRRKVSNQNQ